MSDKPPEPFLVEALREYRAALRSMWQQDGDAMRLRWRGREYA